MNTSIPYPYLIAGLLALIVIAGSFAVIIKQSGASDKTVGKGFVAGSATPPSTGALEKLTPEQKRLLTFGLIAAHIRSEPLLSLIKPLQSVEEVQARLAADYGIQNADEAHDYIDFLLSGFRSTGLDDQLMSPTDATRALFTDIASALSIEPQTIEAVQSTYAWDLGEAAHVAKLGLWARYFTRQEVWNYLEQVSESAQRLGHDWYEYTLSYVLGRTMENQPLGEIRQAINQVYHLSHTDLGRIEGLDAYLRYRFVINKDSTGMNVASHQSR